MADLGDQWQNGPETALIQSGSRSGNSENNSKVESSGTTVDQVATTSSVSKNEDGCNLYDWHKILHASNEEDARKWAQLPPIVKYVYAEDPEVSSMSTSQAAKWRRENFDIQVWRTIKDQSNLKPEQKQPDSKPIPNPVLTFEQAFKNYPEIMEKIKMLDFKKPSPIQSQAWPILLGGEDLIATAPSGTGKTLAYLLPALIHLKGQIRPKEERRVPLVLILVPARELAIQIHRVICYFIDKDIKSVCLYGGNDRDEQIEVIVKGVDIVVATPGRLNNLINLGHLDAINFTYIVYDEADKLFDINLAKEVRLSLFNARPDHQRVFFSATWQPGVRTYMNIFINNITEITVGSVELATAHIVTQEILFLEFDEKDKALLTFIRNMSPTDKVIVFCNTKNAVSHVSSDLAVRGIYSSILHSKLDQEERDTAFDAILQGSTNILVATDVASRGIDIKDLTYVINYSIPNTLEDYVHRIGRTGRAGKYGKAITYMTKYDWKHAESLIKILKEANQEVPNKLEMYAQRYEQVKQKNKSHKYKKNHFI